MPLPLALLAVPGGLGRKIVGKLFGGRKRRRRRRATAAALARQKQQQQYSYGQQQQLMSSVPGRTAFGRGLSFVAQTAAPFLGIGSKKRQKEAVAMAQTPEELIKKYWWIIAIVFAFFYFKKMKMF